MFDTAGTRAIERLAADQMPAHSLMQRAGLAVARLARALAPHARCIWIACGPGNNGGDGLQAAAWLRRMLDGSGCRVLVSCTRGREHMPADARAAWDEAARAGVQWVAQKPASMDARDLCVDALLGIGLQARATPATEEDRRLLELLQSLQASTSPVLCVDTASGLDADTGQYLPGFGPADMPQAPRHTLSLLTLQPGLFTGHGRDACGQIWWDDLDTGIAAGHPAQGAAPCAHVFSPPPVNGRPHASHKGSYGDVAVLGGEGLAMRGMSMTGAAWLAALGALHGGAGRVTLALLDEPGPGGHGISPWPEIMLRSPEAQDWSQPTVACGCGGGLAVRAWLPQVLAQSPRLVLDADALNAVAEDPALAFALQARGSRDQHTVLTPHPLEAARLLDIGTAQVQSQRLQAARTLAQRFQCTVLLKGSGTVIASATDAAPACWINPTGNARLATGGTGDVLAGLIAALWAQGRSPSQAAALAAMRHGALADHWPADRPFSASALALHLGQA